MKVSTAYDDKPVPLPVRDMCQGQIGKILSAPDEAIPRPGEYVIRAFDGFYLPDSDTVITDKELAAGEPYLRNVTVAIPPDGFRLILENA